MLASAVLIDNPLNERAQLMPFFELRKAAELMDSMKLIAEPDVRFGLISFEVPDDATLDDLAQRCSHAFTTGAFDVLVNEDF